MEGVAKDVLVVAPENLYDREFYDCCINGIMFACVCVCVFVFELN